VTSEEKDICIACEMLKVVHEKVRSPLPRRIAVGEVLTKVLAYRDMKRGQEIPIPVLNAEGHPILATYEVDAVFDIWHGMPAFGLKPKSHKNDVPILLFRGTDFSLISERGWASVISDLELTDPGLKTFFHGQQKIHEWLEKAARDGVKASVMGFSLGGSLASYTFIYENSLINDQPHHFSISFNQPGVSGKILDDWMRFSEDKKSNLILYVNRGDIISKAGKLFGQVTELSIKQVLEPIASHTLIVSFQPEYQLNIVNVNEENQFRFLGSFVQTKE
jgi:hypothetical protein